MHKSLKERQSIIYAFTNADYAGDKITGRSQTGFLNFLKRTIVSWYSKKQNTEETSSFGSEFVAMQLQQSSWTCYTINYE
jgi:hypothetical protein